MKKDRVIGVGGLAVAIIMIAALFTDSKVKDRAGEMLHEITTSDVWKQTAFAPPADSIGMKANPLTQGNFVNPGWCPYPRDPTLPVAFFQAPPIFQRQAPSQLIKELGMKVAPTSGGKVKVTGVMGNSWAHKGGLKRNDIILRFNKKRINSLEHFRSLIKKAKPEKDYKVKILRHGRIKSLLVTVGEGEMEGFTAITPVTFMQPPYQCPRCGSSFMAPR